MVSGFGCGFWVSSLGSTVLQLSYQLCEGFSVWGLGCGAQGCGFRVDIFGLRVSGLRFRLQGLNFKGLFPSHSDLLPHTGVPRP